MLDTHGATVSALTFPSTLCRVLSVGQKPSPIMLYPDTVHPGQCTETFTNVVLSSECRTHTVHRGQCTETFTNVMLSPEGQEKTSPIMLYRQDTVNPGQCTETSINVMPSSECRTHTVKSGQFTETSINVMPSSECRAEAQCHNVIPSHGLLQ